MGMLRGEHKTARPRGADAGGGRRGQEHQNPTRTFDGRVILIHEVTLDELDGKCGLADT